MMTADGMKKTAIVVGGGYAGVLAANRLAGKLPRGHVLLVTPGRDLLDRIRLHETIARGKRAQRSLAGLLHPRVVHIDAKLTALDAGARTITIEQQGELRTLEYDALLLALGSGLRTVFPVAGRHAFALASESAARALHDRLCALDSGKVAVIGGGLSAIELAAEISEAHPRLEVELVASELASGLTGPGRDAVRAALVEVGVRVREGVKVVAAAEREVSFADGRQLAVDVSVVATGFGPAATADQLGLPRAPDGRIVVDAELRVLGCVDVFAVGDFAAPPQACIGSGVQTTRMACASAMPLGAHAADQVVRLFSGQPLLPYRFNYAFQCISIGRRRGVIAAVNADDRPTGSVLTGRAAALVKELVCRFVIGALRLERRFPGLYAWPRRSSGALALASSNPKRMTG